MKKAAWVLVAGFLLFTGCAYNNDDANPVGASFSRLKSPDRPSFIYKDTLSLDTLHAYSGVLPYIWSSGNLCRTGFFGGDTAFGFMEFSVSAIPSDFDSLYQLHVADDSAGFHGIDSIELHFAFDVPSGFAYGALSSLVQGYQLILSQCVKKVCTIGGYTTYRADSLFPLDTFPLNDLVNGAEIAQDSLVFRISLTQKKPLFDYLRKAVLERPTSTSANATVCLAATLFDSTANASLLSFNPLLTFKKDRLPQILFLGQARHLHIDPSGSDSSNTFELDSLLGSVVMLGTPVLASDSGHLFKQNPLVTTYYYENTQDTAPPGYYSAVFKINRELFFPDTINSDSTNILGAALTFFLNDTLLSLSEAGQAVDLRIGCRFYDRYGVEVVPDNAFLQSDTVIADFIPAPSKTLTYIADRYVGALTDNQYDAVRTLAFTIKPDGVSFNGFSRIVFKQDVAISYYYSER